MQCELTIQVGMHTLHCLAAVGHKGSCLVSMDAAREAISSLTPKEEITAGSETFEQFVRLGSL